MTSRVVAWATAAGLGVVLVLVAVIAISGARSGTEVTADVRRAGDLVEAYLAAQEGFSQEDQVEDVYKDAPDPALPAAFAVAARQLGGALRDIERQGSPRDRRLAREAMPVHDRYVAAMEDIFAAGARGDLDAMEEINDARADPAQDALQPLINNAAPDYALAQLREIRRLEQTQDATLKELAVVVPVGAVLYALLLVLLFTLRRHLDRIAAAELAASRVQARTDDLTGLNNRRHVSAELDARLEAACRGETPVTLLLLDIDRFKEINDALGHQVGDDVLKDVAARLRLATDDDAVLARLGGDEFVVIVPAPTGPAGAVEAAERLLAALDEPFELHGVLAHVRVSIGVAIGPRHGADATTLLRHADMALYGAKAAGGGVELYARKGRDDGLDRGVMAGDLRAALDDGQIVVHYQPKADLATGTVGSVEALVRWMHPERGLLGPGDFLPMVERHGLMRDLTLRVLELATAQAAGWEEAGRPLQVAVNMGTANLLDVRFPDEVADVLRRSGASPRLLRLEITEDTIMVNPVRVLDVVARLGEMGLTFALDDFGTGYSSLAYLKRLPIQELKIDRSFVIDMDTNSDDAVIVRSTVDLARNLGLVVIAEGVETQATWERLAEFGCHGAQGSHVSKALPPGELDAWLADRVAAAP